MLGKIAQKANKRAPLMLPTPICFCLPFSFRKPKIPALTSLLSIK